MGGQFRSRVTIAEKSAPLTGTTKHPQGRLFNPTGQFAGDPWKLSADNWMQQSDTPAHDDVVSWHSSESSQLPRYDDASQRQLDPVDFEGPDWGNEEMDEEGEYNEDYQDFSVDEKDRPMADYGSAVGMHFGSVKASTDRGSRPYVHPVRIPTETLAEPARGNFSTERPGGGIAAGPHKSNSIIVNSETGERTPDTRWSDSAANFSSKATDLVEAGKTLAYRNDVEARGSTSYRALPETTRTWSEDVLGSTTPGGGNVPGHSADTEHGLRGTPHPALVAAAEQGFNPVLNTQQHPRIIPSSRLETQQRIPFEGPNDLLVHHGKEVAPEVRQRVWENNDVNVARTTHEEAFNLGRLWDVAKPKPEDAWS